MKPLLTVLKVHRKTGISRQSIYERMAKGETLLQIQERGKLVRIAKPPVARKPRHRRPIKYTLNGIPTPIVAIAALAGITKAYASRLLKAKLTPEQIVAKTYQRPKEFVVGDETLRVTHLAKRTGLSKRQTHRRLIKESAEEILRTGRKSK